MRLLLAWSAYLLLAQSAALAQSTPEELRKIARNPFADEIQLTFEDDVTFSQGLFDRSANSLQVQPLFPLSITRDWLVVTRVMATTLAYQPNTAAKSGGTTGSGDSTASFYLIPVHTGRFIWGLGPAILFPTATSDQLGAGKWGLSPSIAFFIEPEWGSLGVLVHNYWSIAGGSKRSEVNQLQLEPMFSYNLPHGWTSPASRLLVQTGRSRRASGGSSQLGVGWVGVSTWGSRGSIPTLQPIGTSFVQRISQNGS